jgi:uncharacterized membrane protein (UPF0127 family)
MSARFPRWCVALLVTTACGEPDAPPSSVDKAQILDAQGQLLLEVFVDLVEDEAALREGLRAYPMLAVDEGLLLSFPVETNICITNSGVPYPIEALFVSAIRQVIAVESFSSGEPGPTCHAGTAMVLELRAGVLGQSEPASLRLLPP